MICWKCKKEIEVESVYRNSECPLCHVDLHCCKGCKFYSSESHYECKESIINPVTDKERANFCDFFSVNNKICQSGSQNQNEKAQAAKDAFNALFGGSICL